MWPPDEEMRRWFAAYRGRVLGFAFGLLTGLLILAFGFFKGMLVVVCATLGYLIGLQIDAGADLLAAVERLWRSRR